MGENYVLGTKKDSNVERPRLTLKAFSEKDRVADVTEDFLKIE